jgi:hypothetical protein
MKMSPVAMDLLILCILMGGAHGVYGDPNARFTHIYIKQSDGTTVDLINGGMASVPANQDIGVTFFIFNPDLDIRSGSYLYILWGFDLGDKYELSKGSTVTETWTWNSRSGEASSYSEHVQLWLYDNGNTVLQDGRSFFISTSPASFFNLNVKLIDQANRPIPGAEVSIHGYSASTSKSGLAGFSLPIGVYSVTASWSSPYNPQPVTILETQITVDSTTAAKTMVLLASVYNITLQLVSPSGMPVSGAQISLAGTSIGTTDADGEVVALQVPSTYTDTMIGYPVSATWFGVDVSPGPVSITTSRTYVLTASNVATLTVKVVGTRDQGLGGSQVNIENSAGTTVFNGIADQQGIVSIEVPYGTYGVGANYKGFTSTATPTVNTPAGVSLSITTDVFIEIFGQPMIFAVFVLLIFFAAIGVLVLAMALSRLWGRKKYLLPPPPPP